MSKFGGSSNKKEVPAMTSSSLSDIVFMLLFFFMVTTQMRETENKVMVKIPEASEVVKLERKDLNSYINIGTPIKSLQAMYGTEARIQLNDSFKTTDDIGKILEKYETETVDRAVENFGYPLLTQRVLKIRGARDWTSRVAVDAESQWLKAGDAPKFRLRWGADDSLSLLASERLTGKTLFDRALEPGDSLLALPERTAPGPMLYRFRFTAPGGDSLVVERDAWFAGGNAALLTSFPILDQKVGWGSLQINQSVERNVLHASDAPFTWGFGAHADSKISIRLARKRTAFRFVAALDDESLCGDGAVFAVSGDGKALWRSKPLYAYDWQEGEVDVTGVDVLTLTTESRDNTMCDHTDWLHPWVE